MEGNKKQNVIIILLTVIIVLLLFLIGFILFGNNKFSDEKQDNTVNNETSINEEVNNNEVSYSNWMNHILDSDIQSITLTRNSDINSEKMNTIKINLTTEDLKTIFVKLNNYNLEKVMITGLGIPENQLDISYKYGEDTYKISIFDKYIITEFVGINKDEQLMNLLNNSKYTDYSDNSGTGGVIFMFDNSYNGSIYNSYFQD